MKKIFNAILSLTAVLSLFSSCTDENVNLGSRVSISQTEDLVIPAEGAGQFAFSVESDGDWVVVVPMWITAEPRHGSGNGTVTLTFADNYTYVTDADGNVSLEMNGSRHASVAIECASGATSFVVRQAGDPDKPSDEIKEVSIGEFLQQPDGAQVFKVTGIVTSIKNTTYGNLYLNDGTGELYIYGILDRDGNAKNFGSLGIGVGDELTLQGSKTTYNGTVEIVNAQYITHVKSLVSLSETSVSVAAAESEFTVGVSYGGSDLTVVSDSQWLAFTGITNTDDGQALAFKAFANTEASARTAKVTVTSTLDGASSSQELTVTQAAASSGGGEGNVFKKVTAITSGKQYLLVASSTVAATPLAADKTYGYLNKTEVVEDNGSITPSDLSLAFVIEETDGGYTIKQSDGRYLYQTGTYNSFNVSDAPAEGQVWTVTFESDGTAKILNNSVQKYIQYSDSFSSFGSYADARGALPALYELQGEGGGEGDGGGEDPVTIFEETFETSQGAFTTDNKTLPEGQTEIWKHDANYKQMKVTAYISGTNHASESWLVSPTIDLSNQSAAHLTFEHTGKYFGTIADEATLRVSPDNGATWDSVAIPTYFSGSDWTFVSSGDIDLSSYAGNSIKIAFRYVSTATKAGTWEVKNVKITNTAQ